MPIQVKTGSTGPKQPFGGSWSAPIGFGLLRTRWGGGWFNPSFCQVKVSDTNTNGYGANPHWVDSGYRGYPATPASIWVHSWDYQNVAVNWSAGSGGAPVTSYTVQQCDSNNNPIRGYDVAGGPSPWGGFPVNQNTYYRFRVRANGAPGLSSPFIEVRVYIGVASQYYETTETATRPWDAYASTNGHGIKDQVVGPNVPGDVVVQTIQYDLGCPWGVLSPYNNREIYWVANGGQQGLLYWGGSEVHDNMDVGDYWGNGGQSGFVCRGSGWTIYVDGQSRVSGSMWVHGYQQYQYQQGHWTNAVGNGYW